MDNLTDFENTEDVSDAAIEWVLREGGNGESVSDVRSDVRHWSWARRLIMLARLIQRHHPELLVDPVDAIVREELAKAYDEAGYGLLAGRTRDGELDTGGNFTAAKRLYLMGIEKGRNG